MIMLFVCSWPIHHTAAIVQPTTIISCGPHPFAAQGTSVPTRQSVVWVVLGSLYVAYGDRERVVDIPAMCGWCTRVFLHP